MHNLDIHAVVATKEEAEIIVKRTAGVSCQLYFVEAIKGGHSRVAGYAQGAAEYACYLAVNDIPAPSALQMLVAALAGNKEAVAAYGNVLGAARYKGPQKWSFRATLEDPSYLQGLIVYRREALEECLHWALEEPISFDWVLRACVSMQGEFIHVPLAGVVRDIIKYTEEPKTLADVRAVYTSCTTCQKRLGLYRPPPPKVETLERPEKIEKELIRPAAPVIRKCCGRL